MTDGIFSFGKKNNRKSSPTGMQNGNQSPGMGTEHLKTSTPRDPKSKSKLDFAHSPALPRDSDSLTRSAEWMHCESVTEQCVCVCVCVCVCWPCGSV